MTPEWLRLDETKQAIKKIESIKSQFEKYMCEGSVLTRTSVEKTALEYSYLLGKINGIKLILEELHEINQKDQ